MQSLVSDFDGSVCSVCNRVQHLTCDFTHIFSVMEVMRCAIWYWIFFHGQGQLLTWPAGGSAESVSIHKQGPQFVSIYCAWCHSLI